MADPNRPTESGQRRAATLATRSFRIADLPRAAPTRFDFRPDPDSISAIRDALGLLSLRKTRLRGKVSARGRDDWELVAHLGATVVQGCVITLEPVTTRIDAEIRRRYVADLAGFEDFAVPGGDEAEMPEDTDVELLPEAVDLEALIAETLALEIDDYPRKDRSEPGSADARSWSAGPALPSAGAEPGAFAALATLRKRIAPPNGSGGGRSRRDD